MSTHTTRAELAARVPDLAGATVLCVGDVMLDRFVEGEVVRISPEAPVPVMRVQHQRAMLGGAGNVARNVAALGARAVLVGLVGADPAADEVRGQCGEGSGTAARLIVDPTRPTSIKTRYLAAGQQLLRTDDERAYPAGDAAEEAMLEVVRGALRDGVDVIVLSDYGKGALTDRVLRDIIDLAGDTPVLVDPKGSDYGRYRGATLVTPNKAELAEASGLPTESDEEVALAAAAIIESTGIKKVLATRGAKGMTLLERDLKGKHLHIPTQSREVFDVSGAGDTVIAVTATALGAGFAMDDAASLANFAAGVAVGKVGTAAVAADELQAVLHHEDLRAAEEKLLPLERLAERVAGWRRRGLAVGFTNGCFDLLHPGHVHLIRQARAACDRLVVGLNADASVRRLKGEGRPIQSEAARAAVLGSLADVDAVVLFDDDTPLALIEALRPTILVKGADYARDQVVGAALVEQYGGRVVLADLLDGHSTSGTIARLERPNGRTETE